MNTKKESPSMDEWLREAKADPSASKIGMYLTHNGVVRETAKAKVRFEMCIRDSPWIYCFAYSSIHF